MKAYLKIGDFASQYGGLSIEEFLARFPKPFLVISIVDAKLKSSDEPTLDGDIRGPNTTRRTRRGEKEQVFTYVACVEKTEEGDPAVIDVGRATTNDIVVYHPSVSRRHAAIHADHEAQTYHIVDQGATYGSEIDGRKLVPGEQNPLKSGSTLVLGKSARCTFLSADQFHRYLQQLVKM